MGGDLKPVKCLAQIVGFRWQSGRPLYSRFPEDPILTIQNDDGERVPISFLSHDEAIEVV
eukprot:13184224-Ditylum_brightwellii.AAC.1